MTPLRFSECLTALYWTEETLARALECDLLLVESWMDGEQEIPPSLAAWLEVLAGIHEGAPPPTTWKGE